ncbi:MULTISPECIES: MobF family relaxase [unclassified Rhizobium]|uniref:MobF family relaxase n=1 Tax=unclassified Rhizobium TaxID=2613769 RepID=UPI0007EBEC50|nr:MULTISPECIES: MobF family relaxase [unclassified Rhizobium]ANL11967.1 conjugal transfer relaxase TraA-like protein [Rhizobium sp. N1341]ANM42812.1 conjugal transfer relaxase TraA-like protein [Rhizobium sp. N741]
MWDRRPVAVTTLQYFRDQDADSRRELGYYGGTDVEKHNGESRGKYFIPNVCTSTIHQSVVHGDYVHFDTADKLSLARDPDTDEPYFTRNGMNAYVAFDCTNSAPKRFSMVKGFAMAEYHRTGDEHALAIANAVDEAHQEANAFSLNWLCEQAAFETRSGTGSKIREIPAAMAFMQFDHFTSRKGDMQVHTHNVLINLAIRPDGSYGAIDCHGYTLWRAPASALYRAKLASLFKEKMAALGHQVEITRDERNINIEGISEELTDTFCKRRKEVLDWVKERYGIEGTAKNREIAQWAAYATRDDKSKLPPIEVLYQLWETEGRAHGVDFASLIEGMDMTAKVNERERQRDYHLQLDEAERKGYVIPEDRPKYNMEEIKEKALRNVLGTESAFEERSYMTAFLEEVQIHMDAEEALELYETVKDESGLIQVGTLGRSKSPVFSSLEILKDEYTSLSLTLSMQGNRELDKLNVIAQRIEEGIAKNDGSGEAWEFTDEQKDLIYSIYGRNQMTIGKGLAGTGKTTAMRAVNDIAERLGYKVWIAAPTNRAVDVLRQEIGIDPSRAFSVQGIANAFEQDKIKLGPKDILIVDESGMVGSKNFARVQRAAVATRALAFIGDDGQLPPVEAGAPFKANLALIGGVRLEKINRQNYDWMLEASLNFAKMKIEEGIKAYDEHGAIDVVVDSDTAVGNAVRRYFELRDKYGVAPVIGNPRNAIVRKVNDMITEELRARGEIVGGITEIQAIGRGQKASVSTLAIMQGMRIITGENVKFENERYANNSFGTITNIEPSDHKDQPYITVKWDDGRTCRFMPHEFIGFRKDDEDKTTPKFAAAYAMTYYATQGMTCHSFINLATHSMSAEETYVAGTRHKEHFEMIIDGSRIGSSLGVKKGVILQMSGTGKTKQEDQEPEVVTSRDEIMTHFIKECSKVGGKRNACDFLGGPKAYLEKVEQGLLDNNGKDIMAFQERVLEQARKEAEEAGTKKPYIHRDGSAGGAGSQTHAEKTAKTLATVSATDNTAAVQKQKAAVAKAGKSASDNLPSLDDNEKAYVKSYDLIDYMKRHGVEIDRTKFTRENDKKHGGKSIKYVGDDGSNKFMIFHKSNGDWGYWTVGDPENKGDIRNFVQFNVLRDRSKTPGFYNANLYLRSELGTANLRSSSTGFKPQKPATPHVDETTKQRYDRLSTATYLADKFQPIRAMWDGAKEAVSGYLLTRRGITKETQAYFRDGFRCEGDTPADKKNKGGVMFKMTDYAGNLYGLVRRGPTTMISDKGEVVPFNKMAYGSERHAVVMGDVKTAERVYTGEAPIDAMSLAQKDGISNGGPKSGIVTLAGSAAEGPLSVIYAISKDRGEGVEWHIGRQNDKPNSVGLIMDDIHTAKIREAILEGCPTAKIVERVPSVEYKDWNDEIRGISRPIPKSAEEMTAEAAVRQASFEARQQAKAKREGYGTSEPPQPTSKGPEMGR